MAISGPFKVEFGDMFPLGAAVVGEVQPQNDFDASTKDRPVQARDKDSGLPVWVIDVMDFDPEARDRQFKVKIASAVQPVPPSAVEGVPVRPVVLEELSAQPYLKDVGNGRQRIAYSLRASGMVAPGRAAARAERTSSAA